MTNDEYEVFEESFRELARPVLESLRQAMITYGDLDEVAVIDHDISRGLGFQSKDNPELFVDLMLLDGAEYGYEGVSLMMTASTSSDGAIWAPGNYSEGVSIHSVDELKRRFEGVGEFSGFALLVASAWDRTLERQRRSEIPR